MTDASSTEISTSGTPAKVIVIVLVLVAIGAILVWKSGFIGSSGPADRSATIESEIGGGATCYATTYEITNRLDGSKARLYDCSGTNKGEICVTETNGIVNDETAAARVLFANTVGSVAPSCAT